MSNRYLLHAVACRVCGKVFLLNEPVATVPVHSFPFYASMMCDGSGEAIVNQPVGQTQQTVVRADGPVRVGTRKLKKAP